MKKFLSLLLAAMLVLSMGVVAMAEGETELTAENATISADGNYVLNNNLIANVVIESGNVTLNLNGHTLTNDGVSDTITVKMGATLTIVGNGTVDNTVNARAAVYNNGTVTLNGGNYTRSQENGNSAENSGGNSYYNILNHGIMTINEGVTVSQSGQFSSMVANGYFNFGSSNERSGYVAGTNHENPELTINGGSFTGGLNTIKNDDNAILTINDGEFSNMAQHVVMNHNIATIAGGMFDGSGSSRPVIWNCGCGVADDGILTITGGNFVGADGVKIVDDVSNISAAPDAKFEITGGTFSSDVTEFLADGLEQKVDGSVGAPTPTPDPEPTPDPKPVYRDTQTITIGGDEEPEETETEETEETEDNEENPNTGAFVSAAVLGALRAARF